MAEISEMDRTEWDVPQELVDIFNRFDAMEKLRNKYVNVPFGYRKARKAALEAGKLRESFWAAVRELYPRIRGRSLEYDERSGKVSIAEG